METEVEGGQGSGENPERGNMMQKWGKRGRIWNFKFKEIGKDN